jgi:hypothetical protein
MDASYVDLANVSHLEFDYLRWMRIVLQSVRARRVLHIGGGACALARALAAEDPGGRQEVCEVDADVLALAREHLGLRRAPGLRVRHAEGRAHIAAQPDGSWDAIVIDAFLGARVPSRLITVEALVDAARVAPLALINVVDNRASRHVKGVASGLAVAYPRVWMLGGRGGNTVIVGCAAQHGPDPARIATHAAQHGPDPARIATRPAQHGPDLARIAARAAADPSPARLTSHARLAQIIAATPPLRDVDA